LQYNIITILGLYMKQYTNVNSLHCGRSIFSSAS
jgi:hypothetical protein